MSSDLFLKKSESEKEIYEIFLLTKHWTIKSDF